MKTLFSITILLFSSISLFGQQYQTILKSKSVSENGKLIIQKDGDQSIIIEDNQLIKLNEASEISKIEVLPFDTVPNFTGIFYYKKTIERETFALLTSNKQVLIYSFTGNVRDLSVEGSWLNRYEINTSGDLRYGPSIIEHSAGNLILTDGKFFYKIAINNGEILLKTENTTTRPAHLLREFDHFLAPALDKPFISRIDDEGRLVLSKEFTKVKRFTQLIKNDNGYFAIGDPSEYINFPRDGFLYKLNEQLDTIWTKQYSGYIFKKMILTNDGGVLITGSKDKKVLLIKINQAGITEWEQVYGSWFGQNLVQLNDDRILIVGHTIISEFYLIISDSMGRTAPTLSTHFLDKGVLDVNNIKNTFYGNGIHGNGSEYQNGVRDDSTGDYQSTFHSSGLWITGKSAEEVYFSGVFFKSDFKSGLIENNDPYFEQVWQIERKEIAQFNEIFKQGITLEEVPLRILKYPAKGNPFVTDIEGNTISINQELAPFIDRNKDSLYNPLDGDYPAIKGDKMLFWIMHDAIQRDRSFGIGLKVSVFCKAYGYDRPASSVLHNTIFVEMDITNKSDIDYSEVRLGLFNDFDIGCTRDDYVGSYPKGDFFYGYNKGQLDNDCRPQAKNTFGASIPVQTTLFLNRKMDKFQYFSLENKYEGLTDPYWAFQFNNLLNAKFTNDVPLSLEGTGYNLSDDVSLTNYAFPGNPKEDSEWTMCQEDLDGLDVRGLGVSDQNLFAAGDQLTFSVAHTFFKNIPHPCPDIEPIANELEKLKEFFQKGYSGDSPIGPTDKPKTKEEGKLSITNSSSRVTIQSAGNKFKIYPVPASDFLNVEFKNGASSEKVSYRMVNHLGQEVFYQETTKNTVLQTLKIDVSHLTTGIYMIHAINKGHIIASKKVLIF